MALWIYSYEAVMVISYVFYDLLESDIVNFFAKWYVTNNMYSTNPVSFFNFNLLYTSREWCSNES